MRALVVVLFLSGCFNPKLAERLACGPGGACPPGQTCGADLVCHRPGEAIPDAPGGARDGAPGTASDAKPDAAPVGCQSNVDCATPPDPCSQAGTCDLGTHLCTFPAVTCTQLDSECAVGACDPTNGACVAMPRNENASCGAGTTCGAFGVCGGFADTCDESGTQSRSCTVNACHAGACVGTPMTDSASCTRASTDGAFCGTETEINCGACGGFSGTCGNDGTQSCTCVQPTCLGGTCSNQTSSTCVLGCTRNTNGTPCNNQAGHECLDGVCECITC